MNNPNELTGKTVLEKLKYYHDEAETQNLKKFGRGGAVELNVYRFTEDMKWCMEELQEQKCLGEDCINRPIGG